MLPLGPIALTAPWMLLGLAALPLIWWLLRITPPTPRRVRFPPVRILLGLQGEEETPAATPLWLALLRLLLGALAVLALAHPVLHPATDLSDGGPVMLVIDDGWAAAPNWSLRQQTALTLVERAKRRQRPVLVLTTAPPAAGGPIQSSGLLQAAEAEPIIRALQPKPWSTDRAAAAAVARELRFEIQPTVHWLSDGVDSPERGELDTALAALGPLQLMQQPVGQRAMALLPPELTRQGLAATVLRPGGAEPEALGPGGIAVRAIGERGRVLGQAKAQFAGDEDRAVAEISLPGDLRNRTLRLELAGAGSAAASILVDERWRRRPVGLVSGGGVEERSQPLLSNLYYLERALRPYAELRRGEIATLLQRPLAVLILADIGRLSGAEQQQLTQWLKDGGMLIRFAGPHLAQGADKLIPTRLRQGGRALGGSLSWSKPAGLATFPAHSPFQGLAVPGDVLVQRQVLAEPSQDLAQHTWASLADGTPLVTAAPRGQGWLVLFHITANAAWSNLPLSGLFVNMMRRLTAMSRGVTAEAETAARRELPPVASLDGFGHLGPPAPGAEPVAADAIDQTPAGPKNPPGYYGREDDRRALNLSQNWQRLRAITDLSVPAHRTGYQQTKEVDLKPWLLLAAVLLALVDLLAVLALRGFFRLGRRRGIRLTALLLGSLLLLPNLSPRAQQPSAADRFAMAASLDTRLAYVLTGDSRIDEMSRAGLTGLSQMLRLRTSIEPEAPMAVNVERDPLVLFPILYWPVIASQRGLSDQAIARISQFMRTGGTILFDTRDGGNNMPALRRRLGLADSASSSGRLRRLLARLDIPPLAPVPQGHVLTKSFYLLQGFPGRYVGSSVWVEGRSGSVNDGVSSLIIGGNDWAAAWATDERHKPLVLPTPGGSRQREMAYRFGINLVMYSLTGNYKSDQVHIPAILERLGQ